jgi:hypothetical protein
VNWSETLREDLRQRAEAWAAGGNLPTYRSRGRAPVVLFEACEDRSAHGNFLPASWKAICEFPEWARRLEKPHSQRSAVPAAKASTAKELDSSNSSDALLMNCFCYPRATDRLLVGLGLPAQASSPVFGFRAEVALNDAARDMTEVDMRLGSLLVEAKLTEKDFTNRPASHVERYAGLDTTFVVRLLPRQSGDYLGYQLIRNVLAARQHKAQLCVLLDQRRPDLLQDWWAVHSAIRDPDLRARCCFRTWQQVRAASPAPLAAFLTAKYGL